VVSIAVTGASLNLAVSMTEAPMGLSSPARVAVLLGVSSALLAAAQVVIWGLVGSLAGRFVRPRPSWTVNFAVAMVAAAAFAPVLGWLEGMVGQLLVLALALVGVAVGSSAVAALIAGEVGADRWARLVEDVAIAGPWLGLASCALVWLEVYRIGSWSSAASLAAVAGWASVSVACVVLLCLTQSRSIWPTWTAASLVAFASVTLALGEHRALGAPPEHPGNCGVLLTVDALRADELRAFNPNALSHPHLDAFLDESVVFTQARSAGPWTKPSFASMLTGLSPLVHGATQTESLLPPAVRTLAERLHQARFLTFGVGNNPFLTSPFGFGQGFDRYLFFPQPGLGSSLGAQWLVRARWRQLNANTEELTDTAISWLNELSDRRFFLWLHILDPHVPYSPPPAYLPPGPAPARIGTFWNGTLAVRSGLIAPSAEERRWLRALYDAEVRYVDDNVGRLMGALHTLHLDDRCVVAFASDHGEEFWDHGGYEHGHTLYDDVIHVPLAFRLPNGAKTGRIEVPVSTESMTATLLELLGLETPPDDVEIAPSLAAYWNGSATPPASRPLVSTGMLVFSEKRAVVEDGLKVIEDLDTGRVEVFDLARDPAEQHPLEDVDRAVQRERAAISDWTTRGARARAALGIGSPVLGGIEPDLAEKLRELGYAR
jgi:arylsulfatase A-like enzyme